jgi:phosphatidylserine decarboxylase
MEIFKFIPAIHKEGYYFIVVFALVTFTLGYFSSVLGWIGIMLTLWCIFFFRDPVRVIPQEENIIVSPADGLVQKIEMAPIPPELEMGEGKRLRVSIFLSVYDVHVNRVPTSGMIQKLIYHPGKFFNASLDKASKHNERQTILMTAENGKEIIFTQIAGLIARRIICNLEEEQKVETGDKFGIIRFGSRMDIYLPDGVKPVVLEGQRAVGGETIIAKMGATEN